MKLGEKPVCAANARTETRCSSRRRRMCSPMTRGSIGFPISAAFYWFASQAGSRTSQFDDKCVFSVAGRGDV
jgi:hypothetical protein